MTIFVAGVHGAGKTFATKPACQKLGLLHATASQLIKEERGQATWDGAKMVSDVDQNQAALISAARRVRENGATLVIDGHFVLRRAPGIHERLPVDVFRALECSSVLLIRSPVPVLLKRLHARQDMSWTEAELSEFSMAEDAHSAEVAEVLGIPLKILDSPSAHEVETWLERLSKDAGASSR
ncbi:MAG: AAA family ATPase [Gammaproteobacteria bacterium]|nr:AAA family ATPase [Gammaproteobacteria bacterium]MBU0786858.1 AAA family ATPase [Gammaproteobacteria bacterium]MBU0813936.1 AAA family ATPase [Gammaproteobacteria bacterium]MBU1788591.1 AAA family ATPase [Gammaproteobacteria bacterium]